MDPYRSYYPDQFLEETSDLLNLDPSQLADDDDFSASASDNSAAPPAATPYGLESYFAAAAPVAAPAPSYYVDGNLPSYGSGANGSISSTANGNPIPSPAWASPSFIPQSQQPSPAQSTPLDANSPALGYLTPELLQVLLPVGQPLQSENPPFDSNSYPPGSHDERLGNQGSTMSAAAFEASQASRPAANGDVIYFNDGNDPQTPPSDRPPASNGGNAISPTFPSADPALDYLPQSPAPTTPVQPTPEASPAQSTPPSSTAADDGSAGALGYLPFSQADPSDWFGTGDLSQSTDSGPASPSPGFPSSPSWPTPHPLLPDQPGEAAWGLRPDGQIGLNPARPADALRQLNSAGLLSNTEYSRRLPAAQVQQTAAIARALRPPPAALAEPFARDPFFAPPAHPSTAWEPLPPREIGPDEPPLQVEAGQLFMDATRYPQALKAALASHLISQQDYEQAIHSAYLVQAAALEDRQLRQTAGPDAGMTAFAGGLGKGAVSLGAGAAAGAGVTALAPESAFTSLALVPGAAIAAGETAGDLYESALPTSWQAAVKLHPQLYAGGELAPLVVAAPFGLAKTAKAVRLLQETKGARAAATFLARPAAAGAIGTTLAQGMYRLADPNDSHFNLKGIASGALLGSAFAGLGSNLRNYTGDQLADIWTRGTQASANGFKPAEVLNPAEHEVFEAMVARFNQVLTQGKTLDPTTFDIRARQMLGRAKPGPAARTDQPPDPSPRPGAPVGAVSVYLAGIRPEAAGQQGRTPANSINAFSGATAESGTGPAPSEELLAGMRRQLQKARTEGIRAALTASSSGVPPTNGASVNEPRAASLFLPPETAARSSLASQPYESSDPSTPNPGGQTPRYSAPPPPPRMKPAPVGRPETPLSPTVWSPSGTKISDSIALKLTMLHEAEVREAMLAQDMIHGDGPLKQKDINHVVSANFDDTPNDATYFPDDHIGILQGVRGAGFHYLHEAGHWIAHEGFNYEPLFRDASEDPDSDLRPVMDAVMASDSIKGLQLLPPSRFRDQYLLSPIECWARAYAQFIASESKDPELSSWLDDVRSGRAIGYARDSQWDAEDFAPIASEFRKLFKKQGWMIERYRRSASLFGQSPQPPAL